MKKHAYLIIAHNNFYILERLLNLLDDKRNDIYIHIDKKVRNFDFDYFRRQCKRSNIKFISPIKVYWGGYSQVQCELNLLKEAVLKNYDYYHLLSGVDLPIKNQDYIHKFFEENTGKEFVRFMKKGWDYNRVSKIHFFNDYCKINNQFKYFIYLISNKLLGKYINKNGYDYTKKFSEFIFMKGDQWFSITNECAHYICNNEKNIKKMFKYTSCPDEHFIHTILYNSKFKEKLSYDTCLREIDWERGTPYTYKIDDYDLLMSSENLFARKFDYNRDKRIIDKIYQNIMGE